MCVFRRGNQDRITSLQQRLPTEDSFRWRNFLIRIEMRQLARLGVQSDSKPWWRQADGSTQQRGVYRGSAQAAGNGDDIQAQTQAQTISLELA